VVSGSGAARGLTITPAAAGTATISLEVKDIAGNSASISFNLLANSLPSISGSPSLAATANTAYRKIVSGNQCHKNTRDKLTNECRIYVSLSPPNQYFY
jgi:hypothetical protein